MNIFKYNRNFGILTFVEIRNNKIPEICKSLGKSYLTLGILSLVLSIALPLLDMNDINGEESKRIFENFSFLSIFGFNIFIVFGAGVLFFGKTFNKLDKNQQFQIQSLISSLFILWYIGFIVSGILSSFEENSIEELYIWIALGGGSAIFFIFTVLPQIIILKRIWVLKKTKS